MIEAAIALLSGVAFAAFALAVWAAIRVGACESQIRTMAGASANILARTVADLERLEIQVAMLRGEHKPETPSRN